MEQFGGDFQGGVFAAVQFGNPVFINVETYHGKLGRKKARQWQTDISETDDGDFYGSAVFFIFHEIYFNGNSCFGDRDQEI